MYSFRIEQAIRAATILHRDQLRKGSVPMPYVSHLVAVAFLVADYTDDEDAVIGALLHDTIEDTDYTEDELRADFGGPVAELVMIVSEPKESTHTAQSWREKKQVYIKQLKAASETALIIAAADKIHNMRSVVEEYYDDHSRFLADFGKKIDDRLEMYQAIRDCLNDRLTNAILHEFNHVFDEYQEFILAVKASQTSA